MTHKRLAFWTVFLGGAGLLAVIPEFNKPDQVVAMVAPAPGLAPLSDLRAAPAPADVPPGIGGTIDTGVESAPGELFAAQNWHRDPPPPPPPPPPAPPPPPPPPSAPALPFTFIGKLDDAGNVKVFLQRGNNVYAVAVGDVIESIYRVSSINAGQMTLIYVPLNIPQSLSIGKS